MKYLKNKSIGFYFSVIGAILALAGLLLYRQAKNTESIIEALLMAVFLLQVAVSILLVFIKGKKSVNLVISAEAVMVAAALVFSFRTQVDALGYVVSGLYKFQTVRSYVLSVVFMLLSLIMFLITSYFGLEKEVL